MYFCMSEFMSYGEEWQTVGTRQPKVSEGYCSGWITLSKNDLLARLDFTAGKLWCSLPFLWSKCGSLPLYWLSSKMIPQYFSALCSVLIQQLWNLTSLSNAFMLTLRESCHCPAPPLPHLQKGPMALICFKKCFHICRWEALCCTEILSVMGKDTKLLRMDRGN